MKIKCYDYNLNICPVCGGKIKHPEQIDGYYDGCLWLEVCNYTGVIIGYKLICRNEQESEE